MRHDTLDFTPGFRPAFAVRDAQAAVMVIPAGGSEGGPDNHHRGADQWLYVVDGLGVAVVDGREVSLGPADLLVIERGERHEIRNLGDVPLKTLNFYSPPAFDGQGSPVGPGKE